MRHLALAFLGLPRSWFMTVPVLSPRNQRTILLNVRLRDITR